MDWSLIGLRIRNQREFMGYTREELAELLEVTPKFCSDIELGLKGMSVQTLCKTSAVLKLSTDYILFGRVAEDNTSAALHMLEQCSPDQRHYAEEILKNFIIAMDLPRE